MSMAGPIVVFAVFVIVCRLKPFPVAPVVLLELYVDVRRLGCFQEVWLSQISEASDKCRNAWICVFLLCSLVCALSCFT